MPSQLSTAPIDHSPLIKNLFDTHRKDQRYPWTITIVGAAGQVGLACSLACVTQGVGNRVVMYDRSADKLRGECCDIRQATSFMSVPPAVVAASTIEETANSRVIVITAGVRQQPGETRLSLVQRNVDIYKTLIPALAKHSPQAVLLIVTNPCDIMAYVAWKLSGFCRNRVISTGCNLDTGRFRHYLASELSVSTSSVHAFILGEHGDSSVPIWSSASVGSAMVNKIEDFAANSSAHERVVTSAEDIIRLKGYTNWGIGFSVANLCRRILHDSEEVASIGTFVQGLFGIKEDVVLAVPCLLGSHGVHGVVNLTMSEDEKNKLQASARTLAEIMKTIDF
ncbi:MAG: uncharacterized protein KVP18_002430 [Porospora cf. gigantea A]|uniref:uncharacterized protein n=1 Tax=Porospora cf. gigantea A TaxID=2853593 RepID=UPI00355968E6|nr:MAG: hypothetical protein KVP18_002430 [Porospora cf. gigantea A]